MFCKKYAIYLCFTLLIINTTQALSSSLSFKADMADWNVYARSGLQLDDYVQMQHEQKKKEIRAKYSVCYLCHLNDAVEAGELETVKCNLEIYSEDPDVGNDKTSYNPSCVSYTFLRAIRKDQHEIVKYMLEIYNQNGMLTEQLCETILYLTQRDEFKQLGLEIFEVCIKTKNKALLVGITRPGIFPNAPPAILLLIQQAKDTLEVIEATEQLEVLRRQRKIKANKLEILKQPMNDALYLKKKLAEVSLGASGDIEAELIEEMPDIK